jgi:aryl-alcohol dehydrogenase-like predicted oxidoreductase
MEQRILGKTGFAAAIFAFGGIAVRDMPQKEAARIVAEAVDRGVNVFDTAPIYGNAQSILGAALKTLRPRVFLASKTGKRKKEGALKELQDSLRVLRTDYLDDYQLQAVGEEEVPLIAGKGGALEALVEAREQGLIRYIGFSSHSEAAALKLMKEFSFDTMMFPVNWASWLQKGMGKAALAEAARQNLGRIAIKGMADRLKERESDEYPRCWYRPIDDPAFADQALRFTLSQDVHTALCPGDLRLFQLGLSILDQCQGRPAPLSPDELGRLREKAGGVLLPVF